MSKKTQSATNVNVVVNNALCSACGACVGMCPVHAIKMHMRENGFVVAEVDEEKCVNCRKCLGICPSNGNRADDDFIGDVISGYIGFASNKDIRSAGQSGGLVTAIIKYLFEQDLIDGAVLARFNTVAKKAENFLALNVQDVLSASGSHYTQTSPVEMILQNQDKRLAVVLLGCQAASLQQIKEKYPNIKLPTYTIGLICGGNNSRLIVDDLLNIGGYNSREELQAFSFRDKKYGGWPGDITFTTKDIHLIPKEKRMELKPHYQNYRCLVCADKMNLHCDMVVGDPWGIALESEQTGYSAVISRTEIGEQLLRKVELSGQIVLRECLPDEIIKGQQIRTELAKRHAVVKKIIMQQGWTSPYQMREITNHVLDKQYEKYIYKKMQYTRKLYLCKDYKQIKKIVEKNKRKTSGNIREALYKIKKKILR